MSRIYFNIILGINLEDIISINEQFTWVQFVYVEYLSVSIQ